MNTTKKEKFAALLNIDAVKANPVLAEWIEHEIELLNRPRKKKPSTASIKNAEIAERVKEAMDTNAIYTSADIAELVGNGISSQKVTAIMKVLGGYKTRDKKTGRVLYSLTPFLDKTEEEGA